MIKKGDRVILKEGVFYSHRLNAPKGATGTAQGDCSEFQNVFICFDNHHYNIGGMPDGGLFISAFMLGVMFKQPDEFEQAIIRIKQGIRANVKKARLAASYNFHALQVDTYAKLRPGYVARLDFRSKFGRGNND